MIASLVLLCSPQWRILPWSVRRAAWDTHVRPLLLSWRVSLAKFGLLLPVVLVLWRLGLLAGDGVTVFLAMLGAIFIPSELTELALVAWHRGRILASVSSASPAVQPVA